MDDTIHAKWMSIASTLICEMRIEDYWRSMNKIMKIICSKVGAHSTHRTSWMENVLPAMLSRSHARQTLSMAVKNDEKKNEKNELPITH